jgi:hypothetical protein
MRRKSRRRVFFLLVLVALFYAVMVRGFLQASSVDPVLVGGETHFVKRCSYVAFRLHPTLEAGPAQPSYDLAAALPCPSHL